MGGTSFECYSGECGCAASDGTCMDHSLQCKYDPTKEFCSNSAIPSTPKGYCPSSASYCKGDSGVYFENSCQCKSDPSIKICSDKACRYAPLLPSSLCAVYVSFVCVFCWSGVCFSHTYVCHGGWAGLLPPAGSGRGARCGAPVQVASVRACSPDKRLVAPPRILHIL